MAGVRFQLVEQRWAEVMAQNQRLDRNGYLIWMAEPQINFGVIIPWTMFAFTESSIVHQFCTVVGEKN
ncbi:hypothetical protein CMK14_07050 [Candidatus Poribacteria bacterium]|nr:hypothetical protein [Candidatus Poribacteria bacterium]